MSDAKSQTLSGVSETYLAPLYWKAMESMRPDAMIKDEKAEALVAQMMADVTIRYDFDRVRQIPMNELLNVMRIMFTREMDRYARDFLSRHPEAVVVHIGCGFDSRFERVDNGQVEWYDLDLPDVIELRRRLIGAEGEGYHLLGCSVLDDTWLSTVSVCRQNYRRRQRPCLFLAEGVFMYFEGAQVKSLVLKLRDRFPGAELVFDAYSPLHVWVHNLQTSTSKINIRVHWGTWRGQKIEGWGNASPVGAGSSTGDRIRLLDEWGFLDRPEPRLAHFWWLRPIDSLFRTMRVYHFQLGKAPEGKD